MKALIALASIVALTGCENLRQDTTHPAYQQCRYEAEAATPTTRNVLEDTVRKMELTNMCIKARSA